MDLKITARSGSRLLDDFDNIEEIGRGAYGQVVKARGKVDGKLFAIKKVRIKKVRINDDQVGNMLEEKVFREVRHLAELNHENVVCYFDSWIENCTDDDDDDADEDNSDDDGSDVDDDYNDCIADGVDIVFRKSGSSSRSKQSGSARGSPKPGEGNFASNTDVDSSQIIVSAARGLMCIKMEYCEHGTLRTAIDAGLFHETETSWRYLREILNGLEYIHRKDIIHRDLNPNNIFIGSNGSAKIGDFGFATFEIRTGDTSHTNTLSPVLCKFRRQISHLSGKAGTALYAAPEVEKPTNATKYTYDTSADMFSLGFIVFEMIYKPIQTSMEKIKIFDSLKKQSYPGDFSESEQSRQVCIINNLLSEDPQNRHTASDLLNPENSLMPSEQVEEKHLQKMKIAVRDPKSKEREILLKEVFDTPDDAEFPSVSSMYEVVMSKSAPSRKVSEQKWLDTFRNACRLHGAIEITLPSVVIAGNKNDVIKLIDETGAKLALIDDHMVPVAVYLSKARLFDASIYSTQPVYKRPGKNPIPNRMMQFSFHLVNQKRSVFAMAETLCLLQKFILSGANSSLKSYRIYINHNAIIHAVLDMCEVAQEDRNSLLGSSFLATIRYQLIDHRRLNISKALNEKLVRIFSMKGTPMAVKDKVKAELGQIDGDFLSIFDELQIIIRTAISMGLKVPITVSPNFTMPQQSTGVVFRLTRLKNCGNKKASLIATGGDCTSLLSTFWMRDTGENTARSRSGRRSGDIPSWISLKIHVDRIISAEVEQQEAIFADSIRAFSCEVVVHFDAGRSNEGVGQICKLRRNGVHAKLMEDKPSKAQLKDYKRLGVSYVVSIEKDSGRDMATVIDVQVGIRAKEVCQLCQIKFLRTANKLELNTEIEDGFSRQSSVAEAYQ